MFADAMTSKNHQIYHPDDLVISGISGVFPSSENFAEFRKNLLSGKDMITSIERYGRTMKIGAVDNIDRFDHTFFHITRQQTEGMTICSRFLLEKTFEAVLDAGYNPQQIKGQNIAVLCGIWDGSDDGDPVKGTHSEDYDVCISKYNFMAANRISNFLDLHGPSCTVNTACSSSMYALDVAVKFIKSGQCEGAIVCSPNFCFGTNEILSSNPILTPTGISAPFSAEAVGYVRGEAVVAMFIQKRKNARRVYANIIHSMTTCDGFKEEGFARPSVKQQKQLYERFYKEIDIDLESILYMEAHGTGTQVGDTVEGASIEEFFCKNRKTPLKIGSVKSNMGHAESAAALCSIAKLIVSFESGFLPPNLRFKNPNQKIKGLHNGKLEVVAKPTPLQGEYFAMNSIGLGGANGHLLLTPHDKIKKSVKSGHQGLPTIVTVSGRTEEAVDCILDDIEKNYKDEEYMALLHEIFSDDISGHLQRGYIIMQDDKPAVKSKMFFTGERRPIWFIFPGMGSQWPTMGKSLMNIPKFADSIQRSHQTLLAKNVDVIKIITEDDPTLFDNITNSFVGIAAIQIALVDVLTSIGIKPDGIIGHSVGELGCAYADRCFTAEQTILTAHSRGDVAPETEFVHGTMAAVGAGYEVMKDLVPAEIEIACHNGPNSCTISGPTEIVNQFMEKLKQNKIFVRRINTANIAFHSHYIAAFGSTLNSHMKKIIPKPRLRSKKWICTSAPESKWDTDLIKYSSPEYHTNNLLSPVLFEEGCRHIPTNAITVEISPQALLHTILQQSLPKTIRNIPLTMKNHQNGAAFLLNSIGQLYEAGCVPKLGNLYPLIEFPVSKSTPGISSLIKWQHDEQWSVGRLTNEDAHSEYSYTIRPDDAEYAFLKNHNIDGRNLYPGLGYLWLVLETMAKIRNTQVTKMPVVFENIRFERATMVPKKDTLKFHVSIHQVTNTFEVTEHGTAVATGFIRIPENIDEEMIYMTPASTDKYLNSDGDLYMKNKDFYKELKLRGYQYEGVFKTVDRVNCGGTYGEILWCDNFVSFMDTMAQILLLNIDTRELLVPTYVRKIVVDFDRHFQILKSLNKQNPKFPVNFYCSQNLLCSGGIQMTGWSCSAISRQKNSVEPVIENYKFVPYIMDEEMEPNLAISTCIDIVLENMMEIQVKTYELLDDDYSPQRTIISHVILDALRNRPLIQAHVNILIKSEGEVEIPATEGITISKEKLRSDQSSALIVLSNIRNKINDLESIRGSIKDNGFILTTELITEDASVIEDLQFNICFSRNINPKNKILLLNKVMNHEPNYKAIKLHNDSYSWILDVQSNLKAINSGEKQKLVIFSEKDPKSGILGFFNCIRREENGKDLRCVYVMDEENMDFSLENSFFKSQLDKNLSHNVYKNGHWGCYRHSTHELMEYVDATHAFCTLEERGNFSSFKWIEGSLNPLKNENSNGKSLIHVYYSSLNFRDVMLSIGKISVMDLPSYSRLSECYHGIEFSGKDKEGTRLVGITENKAIATMVETLSELIWKVPDYMSLQEAATIPVVYSTVIYAFFYKMNLQEGSSVLIHAGSGGIGQAAINICLHYKCNIFTTVGTAEKRQFIREMFPQIPENNIGNSRDTSFEQLISQQTNGRGVDVVLNSLDGKKLQASVRCLAKDGHFLEIGKFDILKNNSLELGHFLKNVTFHSVQPDLTTPSDIKLIRELGIRLQQMLDEGIVKPIQRMTFQAKDVESAFRFMATGRHIGKVLIEIRKEEDDLRARPTTVTMKVKPSVICPEHKSYIIIGGLGGFGMELGDWLILRGARKIILGSRTGVKNGYQSHRIKLWRSYGVKVLISTEDVTKESGVRNLLQMAITLGPVAGIFNLAVILKDNVFPNQTVETFAEAVGPKSIATKHLDNLSRELCPQLEHFVVFSSATCGIGNPRQSNYGYANSVMERICEIRHSDGLPALVIQWGAIGDVGIVAEYVEQNVSLAISGTLQQKIKSCLETLNLLMRQSSNPIVSSMVVAEKRRLDSDVITNVANILGIKDMKTINQSWTLPELGLDSILGMELKQILDLEFDVFLTPDDLRTMTFAKLYKMENEKKNMAKSGKKVKTQFQALLDERITNHSILRIPLDENQIEKPIVFDENPIIFMLPGVEGLAITMETMAKNLPAQILCFQYHFSEDSDFSIKSLCNHFAKYILENYPFKREFCIIGYSMGGLLALQIVDILEKYGKKGRLYLIDSSPLIYQKIRNERVKEQKYSNEENIQNEVCLLMLQILLSSMNLQRTNMESIKNMKNWQAKKKLSFSLLPLGLFNEKFMNRVFDRIYNMVKALFDYQLPRVSLESSCVLIRCEQNPFEVDEDYGLSEYFRNPIEIHQVDADHVSILNHKKTSEIIMESTWWKT